MLRRFAGFMTMALVVTACSWPMAGQGASRRGWDRNNTIFTSANVATVVASWSAAAPGSAEVLGSSAAILGTGPSVRAFDPATGAAKWTIAAQSAAIRDADVFTTANGTTCTLRRGAVATGVVNLTTTFGGPTLTTPTFSACAITGTVLDSDSSVVVPWVFASTGASAGCGGATGWVTSSAITAFDGTLTPVWNRTVTSSGCGAPPSDLLTRPRFGDVTRSTNHWVATYGNSLVALPVGCVGACTPSWSTAITNPIGPALSLSKTTVALIDGGGTVRVLDEATGGLVWGATVGSAATAPLAATNARLLAIGGSTLYVFRAGGCGTFLCGPTFTAPIGFTTSQRPSIAGDTIFVAGGSSVAAFDDNGCGASTCTPLTTKSVTGTVSGPPSIVSGRVLVPTSSQISTFTLPG